MRVDSFRPIDRRDVAYFHRLVVRVRPLLVKMVTGGPFLPRIRFSVVEVVRNQTYDEIAPPITAPSTPVQSDNLHGRLTRLLSCIGKLLTR